LLFILKLENKMRNSPSKIFSLQQKDDSFLTKKEMKKILFSALCLMISTLGFSTGVIVLDGVYQGKNIYIQNPFSSTGVGFCVQEVRVNGNVTTDEIASSAFEIDLHNFQLKFGDKVEVKIIHKDDCKPKVLNPEVLNPKSTYEIVGMSVDDNFTFKWSTRGETGKLTYTIEQFRWNKWVKVGEMEGVGSPAQNDYMFRVVPHSGKNKFRVKQIDYTGQPRISRTVEFESKIPEVTFSPAKVTKEIGFYSADKPVETLYEIYDQYGNIVKRGFSAKIDAADLTKGAYYLNFDNVMAEFIKK
jgi:hypothetical protein